MERLIRQRVFGPGGIGGWTGLRRAKPYVRNGKSGSPQQTARYEWEIDPDDAKGPTIHGLRGTGLLLRWSDGYDVNQISNDIGMSRQTVEHYMRFKDQMEVAARGYDRLRLVKKER